MRTSSSSLLIPSPSAIGLTAAIAVILLATNFTITSAQQQSTSRPGEIENGTAATTTFQSTEDSFRVQVPEGWIIQDVNNTGSALLEEATQGYGVLAELCPQEEQQAPSNVNGGDTASCQGSEEDVIYIIRYPKLDTRSQVPNNVTTNNNMTIDNILLYHLQKLEEVGYRGIQIANSTETTVNLTIAQTNQTIERVPGRLVEMTYSTNFAPNEIRGGYFILTASDATTPNLGTTKGYTILYEGSPVAAEGTTSDSLLPPIPVRQIFDSFELIAAPELAQAIAQEVQAAETAEDRGDGGDGDEGNGDHGGDEGDRDEGDSEENNDGGDDDGDGEEGPTMAERIIEEGKEMAERIIEETGVFN